MTIDYELDLGDVEAGWAVFNLGTVQARLEKVDEIDKFKDDTEAIKHCIAHAGDDPRCLRALCETYATDDLVQTLVKAWEDR
jgi:hypothetical protein